MYITVVAALSGVLAGIGIEYYIQKQKAAKHRSFLRAKKKSRQKSIHERFRVEVKNNVIRLNKEEKRLALSKQIAPVELLLKNYKKRLHKVADRDLRDVLHDFYKELIMLLGMYEAFMNFTEKNIRENDQLSEGTAEQFYNYMTSSMLNYISDIRERGAGIVAVLEEKISAG